MIDLPEGLSIAESIDSVPDGALITSPGVSRKCVRCGHMECPCCNGWCDLCLDEEPKSYGNSHVDGQFIVTVDIVDDEDVEAYQHRSHIECARHMACKYDREPHPFMALVHEYRSKVFVDAGGAFNMTDDGRVWFRGQTQEEFDRARVEREDAYAKRQQEHERQLKEREVKMSALKEMFSKFSPSEQSAYVEGMRQIEMLVEWVKEDFQFNGKKISTSAVEVAQQRVAESIAEFAAIQNSDASGNDE